MTMTPEGGQPITLPPPTKGLPPNVKVIPTPAKQAPAPVKK